MGTDGSPLRTSRPRILGGPVDTGTVGIETPLPNGCHRGSGSQAGDAGGPGGKDNEPSSVTCPAEGTATLGPQSREFRVRVALPTSAPASVAYLAGQRLSHTFG